MGRFNVPRESLSESMGRMALCSEVHEWSSTFPLLSLPPPRCIPRLVEALRHYGGPHRELLQADLLQPLQEIASYFENLTVRGAVSCPALCGRKAATIRVYSLVNCMYSFFCL